MDDSIAKVGGNAGLLGKAFSFVGDVISGLVSGALRILEYTLGSLLASAIRSVISAVKELISSTIEAGSEFQTLELRLRNLNLNAALNSTSNYTEAMNMATEATKEQLAWIQKLAIQTPYDTQDIANVFTLARSYGFAADESQTLTESISNFAAGMGLGNQEIERIIVNFGQMVQQGKASGREMTDLARGAFVPVNDILKIMQEETGLTGDAFDEFRNSGEGVQSFINAFIQLVGQRFPDSARTMARTFQGATDNLKDFVKSIFGLNVVKPVLDTIGGAIADVLDAFTKVRVTDVLGEEDAGAFTFWEKIVEDAKRIGDSISDIVTGITGLLPSADSIALSIVDGMESLASWLEDHEGQITGFFEGIRDAIMNDVVPFIRDELIPNFKKISDWVTDNKDLIFEFFTTLGEIVGTVFTNLTGGAEGPSTEGILGGIQSFMQFVVDNKDAISDWATVIVGAVVAFSILSAILTTVVAIIIKIIGFVLGAIGIWTALVSVMEVVGAVFAAVIAFLSPIGPILLVIVAAIIMVIIWIKLFQFTINQWKAAITAAIGVVKEGFVTLKSTVQSAITQAMEAARRADWVGVGKAIILGIVRGITTMVSTLVSAAVAAVTAAYEAAKGALGIESPSKLFAKIGEFTMQGMAKGIVEGAGMVVDAMTGAMAQIAQPAMAMASPAGSSSVTNNNTRNLSLTVNSSARTEPIIQDFNMLQAMAE